MEMKRMLYVTGLLLCTSLGGYAQEGNLIDVKVVNEEVKKQGSEVSLRMTLDLTGLRVGNQKSVCLHPAVVSADGTHEAVLAPVVVDGKTRSRVHRREKALTGASPATDNAYTVLRSGRESRVEYIAKLAYEPWMVDSRLVLRERMTGCLDCTAATEESTVKAPFIKLFTPRYVTPFVTPEREAVKVRNGTRGTPAIPPGKVGCGPALQGQPRGAGNGDRLHQRGKNQPRPDHYGHLHHRLRLARRLGGFQSEAVRIACKRPGRICPERYPHGCFSVARRGHG